MIEWPNCLRHYYKIVRKKNKRMKNPTFTIQPAKRIANFKPYFFSTLNKKLADLKAKGVDVIRIDMGSPDLPPESFIIDKLVESARRPDKHGYPPIGGTKEYREAVAWYYHRRFNVQLDPKLEVLGLIGSKEGLFTLSQILLNPDDLVLIPDPGYPIYTSSAEIAGARIYSMPLLKENNFLPDLDAIPAEIADQAKLMWLNYPNNPTGAIAPYEFFEKAVDYARKHGIILAHDAPYADVCFDGYHAPSLLSVPGAKDVAVEFNSLAKAYNMAGWRLGMAVGNPDIIRYLDTYKSQVDTSQFIPVVDAGIAALTGDQEWIEDRNQIYQERRDIVLEGLREVGFITDTPAAAIYVWAHLPKGYEDSTAFCDQLLEATGVSATPGVIYGGYGEGYIRISLGTDTPRLSEAIQRIVRWFKAKS
jgi:LL-diaminopimelate aminotransferase